MNIRMYMTVQQVLSPTLKVKHVYSLSTYKILYGQYHIVQNYPCVHHTTLKQAIKAILNTPHLLCHKIN